MKRFVLLPLAAVVALAACNEAGTIVGPEGPRFELVDTELRVAADDVNARVSLSFAIPFEIEAAGAGAGQLVPVAQADGIALNFPGNQSNAGMCEGGTWKNKNGKGMGGTAEKPHPHCTVWQEVGGTTTEIVRVVLEPISARYFMHNASQWRLAFTNESGDNGKVLVKNNEQLKGNGTLVAWAVFEDDPDQRVGQVTINLAQFDDSVWDDEVCDVADELEDIGCLAQLIDFSYTPIAAIDGGYGANGFGVAGSYEESGFLYWTSVGSGWYRID